MLIGAHVSTGGGLAQAYARGIETESDAIQIFNQSPRMWRPVVYKEDDIAAFRQLMADGPVQSVVIHAVYLINCASDEPEIRSKSLASLIHALRLGDAIGDDGVSVVGLERLRCLHVNDSKVELGSNRDRHAAFAKGELGRDGLATFLSEPRFDGLPALIETGSTGKAPDTEAVRLAKELREKGLAARGGRGGRKKRPRASAAGRRSRG